MTLIAESKPCYRTAEEHDIYILGLVCGLLSALKDWSEEPRLMGIEQVEDVLGSVAAYVEGAVEFGEKSFETKLRDELSGTRISPQALREAWELGWKNGLHTPFGPLPDIARPRKDHPEPAEASKPGPPPPSADEGASGHPA